MYSKTFYTLIKASTVLTKQEMKKQEQFDELYFGDNKILFESENRDVILNMLAEHKNEYVTGATLYFVDEYGVQEVVRYYDEDGILIEEMTAYGDWWTAQDDEQYPFEKAHDIANGHGLKYIKDDEEE